jgi:hypothetical protein
MVMWAMTSMPWPIGCQSPSARNRVQSVWISSGWVMFAHFPTPREAPSQVLTQPLPLLADVTLVAAAWMVAAVTSDT